jgi:hypothetical protein
MAIFLNNNVGFKLNSVDLSDHVTSITINRQADQIEISAMGDTAHKFVTGLESSTITVSFLNDTASASVLQTLQDAWGTTVPVSMIQQKGTAVSATNKSYATTVLIDNITDINGAVGDEATIDITFTCNSKIVPSSSTAF